MQGNDVSERDTLRLVGEAAHFFEKVGKANAADGDNGKQEGQRRDTKQHIESGDAVVVTEQQCQGSSERSDRGQQLAHRRPQVKLRSRSL